MSNYRKNAPVSSDRSSLDALSRTLEGLEARVEGLLSMDRARADYTPQKPPQSDPLAEIRIRQRMLEENRQRAVADRERRLSRQPQDNPRAEPYRAPVADPRRDEPRHRAEPAPRLRERSAELQDIADHIVALREDLKQDISDNMTREFRALQNELRDLRLAAAEQGGHDDLRGDLQHLGDMIARLAEIPGRQHEVSALKSELEDLRFLMNGSAREDTIRGLARQIDDVGRNLASLNGAGLSSSLGMLASRVDSIKSQLDSLDSGPAIRLLDDKLMAIVEAMEDLGRHIQPDDRAYKSQFAGIDSRLDEISRAIAASARAPSRPTAETESLLRLEERMADIADRLASVHNPAAEQAIGQSIDDLRMRLDHLAGNEPAKRLEERLDKLSAMLERNHKSGPAPELTGYLADISRKIDALERHTATDVMAERLDDISDRIAMISHAPYAMDTGTAPQLDLSAFRRIEGQLSSIADKLNQTTAAPQHDNHALRNLERQIAHLTDMISAPGGMNGELGERVAMLESSVQANDEYIIEAARHAAEAVVEAYGRGGLSTGGSSVDIGAISALAEDLRHLEELSHQSEERNLKSFEAIHETLLQIAGRLNDIDHSIRSDAPAMASAARSERTEAFRPPQAAPRMPSAEPLKVATSELVFDDLAESDAWAEDALQKESAPAKAKSGKAKAATVAAPAEAPKTSLFARLTAKLKGSSAPADAANAAVRANIEPPPIAPEHLDEPVSDDLLEPGSGSPNIKQILERVRASQSGQRPLAKDNDRADFISAARRAAQAAAQDVSQQRGKVAAEARGPQYATTGAGGESDTKARLRRPLMMAAGAVLLVIMSLPLIHALTGKKSSADIAPPAITQQAPVSSTMPAQPAIPAPITENRTAPTAPTADQIDVTKTGPTQPLPVSSDAEAAKSADAPLAPRPSRPVSAAPTPATTPAPAAQATPAAPAAAAVPAAPVAPVAAGAMMNAPANGAGTAALVSVPDGLNSQSLGAAARAGDPAAFFEIAARYTEGRGLTQNMTEAASWYQRAADAGLAPAIYRLGNLYEKGNGVAKDLNKARDLYQRSADMGNAAAMHNLAVFYATGAAGTPDFTTALKWFNQAANLGVVDSQYNLAILYARGNGVQQDLVESYKWFAIAAKGGDKDAGAKRDEVAKAMQPQQLESARAKVEAWKAQTPDARANVVNTPDEWVGKADKTGSINRYQPVDQSSPEMKKAIRNIQAILNKNGFDAGQPDGELGAKTVAAIKVFQTKNGMTPDGKISDQLVKALLARNK